MFGKIQKEDKKNKLLPYSSELDEESYQNLKEIKTHFGSLLLSGELREPLLSCLCRLENYIDLYGLKFSKQDHVLFVEIIYDLITLSDMSFNVLSELYSTLRTLLKKKKFLIPLEDLTLPWRPLYEICKKVFLSDYLKQTAYNIDQAVKTDLEKCVLQVRYYFPPSATQEILDEFRPMLCPFDNKAMKFGVQMLSWFLPLYNPPELVKKTYYLWLDELIQLWDTCCNNSFVWEDHLMYLMAWLAIINSGHIDWEKHIPTMYTRILKTFNLPVSYKKMRCMKVSKLFEDRVASWIVSSLGGGSVSQDYLDQLLKTLESYCHSANTGYWAFFIKSFLKKLTQFFLVRIKRERFKEPYWNMKTPENKKLKDEDVNRFVVSVQSISMLAMFSPTMFIDFTKVFRELATLRPDLVVPPLLEKFYSTIDCVTEPHKYIAVLKCVHSVARPMLINGLNSSYPEGKKHVIPLLFAVLPGIDPNDHQKSVVTIQFIYTFINMIPIVDCSSICSKFPDITIEEEEVASATSQFEEFILQFMDRVFLFIERASQENVRFENHSNEDQNKTEKHIIDLIRISCTIVIGQLSYPIFLVALKKMYDYSMFKIFEREIAGFAVAAIIKAFAKINGEETFKLFIPKLCTFILEAAANQDFTNEETLDNELLYKMLILSEIVSGSPTALTEYIPTLLNVLNQTLHIKCKEGSELSATLLSNILSTLSNVCPINYYEHNKSYKQSEKEILPLREWGKGSNFDNLKIDWYVPKDAEILLVEKIFWKFLLPELEIIEKYTKNESEISRESIRCTLTIIQVLFSCCHLLAPMDQSEFLKPKNSKVPFVEIKLCHGVKRYIKMPDGSNVYEVMIDKMASFQSKLLRETDDTVSFVTLSTIWSYLLMFDMKKQTEFNNRKLFVKIQKKNYLNLLGPCDSNIHSILVEEVAVKHMHRVLFDGFMLRENHKTALLKLFELATNDYKSVQTFAWTIFYSLNLRFIDKSFLINEINKNLKLDTTKYSEKFKSTLIILRGRSQNWNSFADSYKHLRGILPAIVTSMPSEELAVVKLLDELVEGTVNINWYFGARLHITQNLLEKAKRLWSDSSFELLYSIPSDDQIQQAASRVQEENEKILKDYNELIQDLVDTIQKKNLQWRYEIMAASYISLLLLPDEPFPIEVVRYYLGNLIHDSVNYRKIAIKCIVCIMKMSKPKSIKEKVDPFSIKKDESNTDCVKLKPGSRSDNAWCYYNQDNVPKNADQWNEVRYLFKCYMGYYTWPREMFLHSSSNIQPVNNVQLEKMTDTCREIDVFFSNSENIEKLIEYLCLEEKKGELLRSYNISLFKYLFKIYGDKYFDTIAEQFEKILDRKEESYQRCAAEMIAGMIRGIKLWSFEKSQKMINWCGPLLRKALDNMTVETQKNWGSSIATSMLHCDVNKSSYLFELLMEEPIKGDAAFRDCGRLYVLQSGVLHTWKLSVLWHKLLEYIKPYLANQYQDLRKRLGSVLVTIFETDIDNFDWNRTSSPHVSDFINYLLPKLEILYKAAPNSHSSHDYCNSKVVVDAGEGCFPEEDEIEKAILLLKTICEWCIFATQRCVYPLKKDFFKFFPLFCLMENYDKDEELKKNCKLTLSLLSFTPVSIDDIPVFIEAFEKISSINSWSARCTVLDFLQVFTFHNLFFICSRKEWISEIMATVLRLLEDNRCEVRQKAGEVLSGFIHYDIIKDTSALIKKFKKMSKISLKEKNNINIRHAGVIGLCSFINAFPYTVPPEIPPLFVEIGVHLSDPEPIPGTIRKTLGNFKRTHYSDWNESKLKFTADQLDIFTDIIMPPNHYA